MEFIMAIQLQLYIFQLINKTLEMNKLVLIRHGESLWNRANRFTGWTDVDLTEKGIDEACAAGKILKNEGFCFDIAFTSFLKRAIRTLWIVLGEMDLMWIPVEKSWRLNERHYGALQGLNKSETAAKYGEQQVLAWRRSFGTPPPVLPKTDPRYPGNEDMYRDLSEDDIPVSESLKDTIKRVIPYWEHTIMPTVENDRKVLIVAHGNSLRALVKYFDDLSDEEIVKLNIPTGVPLVYELDNSLKPLKSYYLGDQQKINEAINKVSSQGKAKY